MCSKMGAVQLSKTIKFWVYKQVFVAYYFSKKITMDI